MYLLNYSRKKSEYIKSISCAIADESPKFSGLQKRYEKNVKKIKKRVDT